MKNAVTLILLASLLTSLASCGGGSGTTDTSAADSTTAGDTVPTISDNLPERDMGGFEFTIYIPNPEKMTYCLRTMDVTETNGEVLNDAIYDRNRRAEERFNCRIAESWQGGTGVSPFINAVMAGDNTFKIAQIADTNTNPVVSAGVLTPWDDLAYVDLDADWWNDSAAQTFTIGGKVYGAVGDFNLSEYSKAYMLYFNKDIYAEIPDQPSLYDYVLNGTWTLDKFTAVAKQYARDLNGDTVMNENDQWGFVGTAKVGMQMFISGAGVTFIETNADGDPYFGVPTNQSSMEKMQSIIELFSGSGDWYSQLDNPMGGMNDAQFIEGKTLFQAASIWNTDTYREVEQDIGMLPAPKFDEDQADYHCITAGGLISMVPKSLSEEELENTGIICEALAFDSRRNVLPVYKETVLKGKYARDEESIQIIDIIFDAASFDAGVLLWGDIRTDYVSGPFFKFDGTLASTTESIKSKIENTIKKTVDAVNE